MLWVLIRFSVARAVVAGQCDMWFLKMYLEAKFLHTIECDGPLLILSNIALHCICFTDYANCS